MKVHYIDLGSGGAVDFPAWEPDVMKVIFHIRLDLRGYEHVAIDAERPDGTHVITFRDVAYDPDDGAVYGVCMEPVARMGMRSGELRWRISGVRTGKRELVAEYESRPV